MPIIPMPRQISNFQNNYNINMGNNSHISAIASENVNDNSSNTFSTISPELFNQVHTLIEEITSEYKNVLLAHLEQIEQTKNSGDKRKCMDWIGRFFSLASIADCITVAQPLLPIISWLFK